jgi:hypothetical protein
MISSIRIEGYRGFDTFEMDGLGRINLLVGTNNSGKTSVLEAVYLLYSAGDADALKQLLWWRGEQLAPTNPVPEHPFPELAIAHLFAGHALRAEASIRISAAGRIRRTIQLTVKDVPPKSDAGVARPRGLNLEVRATPQRPLLDTIELSASEGLITDMSELRGLSNHRPPALFIAPDFSSARLATAWNSIALTPSEELVLEALRFLDSSIERIAQTTTTYYPAPARGGFIVKRAGSDLPVPIGSMGDGMWRMLAMSIAITQCRGGVLLVDEIDTGLHYSVMSQMWKLIYNAAQELDVQIFATTHSYDCVYSLAQMCSGREAKKSVTVQRIEVGKKRAVPYDEEEITVAASRDIEVR